MLDDAGAEDAALLSRRICALLDGLSIGIALGDEGLSVDEAVGHARAQLPAALGVRVDA